MLKLLFTADYELFGDGSGDLETCVLNPTEQILSIAEQFNTKITLFADVCELWAFEKAENDGLKPGHAQPATAVCEQLQNAVLRGHDVQLHVHPQWIGASWNEISKTWNLQMDSWRTGLLPKSDTSSERVSAQKLVARGQSWLEALLRPIDEMYRCKAFRAGAWSIQPEESILQALINNGFFYDTTVAPRMQRDDGLSYFDFSEAPTCISSWAVSDSVTRPEKQGKLLEIPIYTRQLNYFETIFSMLYRRCRPKGPIGCNGRPAKSPRFNSTLQRLLRKFLIRSERIKMFDFCALSLGEMKKMVHCARQQFEENAFHPLVVIGHPKTFGNPRALKLFLAWCQTQPYIFLEHISENSFWRTTPFRIHNG